MDKKKDQHIALCTDSVDHARQLLPQAQSLAASLRKGLILFSCAPDADSWAPSLGVPFAVLKSDWPTVVESLPTLFNAVLAVIPSDLQASAKSSAHPRQILRNFRQSKTAYLLLPVHAPLPSPFAPTTVALTLNHQRESKEKLLWASYFARFCHSRIVVRHHPYTDPAFLRRLQDNLRYLDKVFASLGLDYQIQPLADGNQFADPDPKAILTPGVDLFIALVPDQRDRDLLDLLAPPPSLRLVKKNPTHPILFLNQRDDLYIMCD